MTKDSELNRGDCGLVGESLKMRESSVRQLHRLITEGMSLSLQGVIPEDGHVWVVGTGVFAPELDVIDMAGRSKVKVIGVDSTHSLGGRLKQKLQGREFLPKIDFSYHYPTDVIAVAAQESASPGFTPPDLIMMMRDNLLKDRSARFYRHWRPIIGVNTVIVLSGSAGGDFSVFDPESVTSVLNDGGKGLQYRQFDLGRFPDPYPFYPGHMGIVIFPEGRESDIFRKSNV